MKKKHIKPTGEIKPHLITGYGSNVAPNRFIFPETKEDIEEKVANLFFRLLQDTHNSIINQDFELVSNEENDLDFAMKSKEEIVFLELTEIIPQQNMKGGYKNLPNDYNIGAQAQVILDLILKKSNKYAGIKSKIFLLMYITDDMSSPSMSCEKLVIDFLKKNEHSFVNIWFFIPILEDSGPMKILFPSSNPELIEKEVNELRTRNVRNISIK